VEFKVGDRVWIQDVKHMSWLGSVMRGVGITPTRLTIRHSGLSLTYNIRDLESAAKQVGKIIEIKEGTGVMILEWKAQGHTHSLRIISKMVKSTVARGITGGVRRDPRDSIVREDAVRKEHNQRISQEFRLQKPKPKK